MASVVVRQSYAAINAAIEWLNRFGEHAPIQFGGEQDLHDQLSEARENLEIAYPELKVEEGDETPPTPPRFFGDVLAQFDE